MRESYTTDDISVYTDETHTYPRGAHAGGTERLRVGIVGLGSIGQRYARILHDDAAFDCDLVAFRRDSSTPIPYVGIPFDVPIEAHNEGEFELVHNINPLGLLIVCSPTIFHYDWAMRALEVDLPMLVEKPLYDPWSQHISGQLSLWSNLYIGYQLRMDPAFNVLVNYVSPSIRLIGDILKVQIVNHEYLPGVHPWEADWKQGYAARRDLGGGVLNCYSHEIDYAICVFGVPDAVSCVSPASILGTDVEEDAHMVWRYPSYELHMDLSFLYPRSVEPSRMCRVYGTRGMITWNLNTGRLTTSHRDGSSASVGRQQNRDDLMCRMLSDILYSTGSRFGLATSEDGMKVGAVTEAAIASIKSGGTPKVVPRIGW